MIRGFFQKTDPKFRINERGIAEPLHVIAGDWQFIGKEADRIADKALTRGQVDTPDIRYGGSDVLDEALRSELAAIADAWGGASKLAKRLRMHPDTLLKVLRGEPVSPKRLGYILRSLPYLTPEVVGGIAESKSARLAELRSPVETWVQQTGQAAVAKAIGISRDSLDRFLKGRAVARGTIGKVKRAIGRAV